MDAQGSVENAKEDTRFLLSSQSAFITAAHRVRAAGTVATITSSLNSDNGSGAVVLYATPGVGDRAVFGSAAKFNYLEIDVITNGAGTWTITWQHWDGSAWANLSGVSDGSSGFTAGTGVRIVSFDIPDDWEQNTVGGAAAYYIGALVSAFTSITTNCNVDYARTILYADNSQYSTPLTRSGSGGYELASARTTITGGAGREVYVRCELEEVEVDAVLVAHHNADASDLTFAILTNSSGQIELRQNTSVLWTGTGVPNSDLSISWSTRANPDTTGSGDALISEIVIYDHTVDDLLVLEQFVHAEATTDAGWTFAVGGIWDGSAMFNPPTNPVTAARVSSSYHPHTEFFEDWVDARASHSHTLDRLIEPLGAGLDVGGQGEWAGQANVGFAAAHANALRGRMLSPMLNEVYSEARTLTATPDPTQWMMTAPGGSAYLIDATKLRWLPCDGWEYAQVWVQVQSWVTLDDPVPVGLRCYAMNRPHIGLGPTLNGQPMPPLEYVFGETIITEDHTSGGEGEWLDLGVIKLPMMGGSIEGWSGSVTLGLAYAFDPAAASSNDANARLKIKAWDVLPVVGEP